jgi:hypothetical protein
VCLLLDGSLQLEDRELTDQVFADAVELDELLLFLLVEPQDDVV